MSRQLNQTTTTTKRSFLCTETFQLDLKKENQRGRIIRKERIQKGFASDESHGETIISMSRGQYNH